MSARPKVYNVPFITPPKPEPKRNRKGLIQYFHCWRCEQNFLTRKEREKHQCLAVQQ